MHYELDLTYDFSDPLDVTAFNEMRQDAAAHGVIVKVKKEHGPGGGWPVIDFHVLHEGDMKWFVDTAHGSGLDDECIALSRVEED